mmetsp:Transcript_21735/g.70213  ORF Transcript_21735/g.70213 Transcript_21735/m.70213 type:complete len:253 (+) Transcript_21735:105-863(+)
MAVTSSRSERTCDAWTSPLKARTKVRGAAGASGASPAEGTRASAPSPGLVLRRRSLESSARCGLLSALLTAVMYSTSACVRFFCSAASDSAALAAGDDDDAEPPPKPLHPLLALPSASAAASAETRESFSAASERACGNAAAAPAGAAFIPASHAAEAERALCTAASARRRPAPAAANSSRLARMRPCASRASFCAAARSFAAAADGDVAAILCCAPKKIPPKNPTADALPLLQNLKSLLYYSLRLTTPTSA